MNNNQGRRRTRRVRQQRKQKNTQISRILLTICMMALVAVVSIGGTMAWLTDQTETISNTFTSTDIDVTLTETLNTDTDNDGVADAWVNQLIPGKKYAKDPVVTVDDKTNVESYLFVKFEEVNNTFGENEKYLIYDSVFDDENSGWTQLTGEDIPATVWYRTVAANTGYSCKLLNGTAGEEIQVNPNLTKEEINKANNVMPSLTYTAYAIQTEGFTTPDAAWAEVSK